MQLNRSRLRCVPNAHHIKTYSTRLSEMPAEQVHGCLSSRLEVQLPWRHFCRSWYWRFLLPIVIARKAYCHWNAQTETVDKNAHSWAVGCRTSASLVEVVLHVVAVDFCATEDNCLVHIMHLDGTQCVLTFQYLHCLRKHLYNIIITVAVTSCIAVQPVLVTSAKVVPG